MTTHFDLLESNLPELVAEGISFLGTSDSAKPVFATWLNT